MIEMRMLRDKIQMWPWASHIQKLGLVFLSVKWEGWTLSRAIQNFKNLNTKAWSKVIVYTLHYKVNYFKKKILINLLVRLYSSSIQFTCWSTHDISPTAKSLLSFMSIWQTWMLWNVVDVTLHHNGKAPNVIQHNPKQDIQGIMHHDQLL